MKIQKIKKNFEIFSLVLLIFTAVISTSLFNLKENKKNETYNNFVDNIYLKKTLSYLVSNLEPKYLKIKHKINKGETFDAILEGYLIDKKEIIKIKKSLNKNIEIKELIIDFQNLEIGFQKNKLTQS